jgi:ABC-type Fe3+-hydroxamate transport system substrate-binding protein
MTESLFDLGFGASVVGVTDYCLHPTDGVNILLRVGGPKNPDVGAILDLKPDLVFANQEENTPQAITQLLDAGVRVWVTFPKTVEETLDTLLKLLGIYHSDAAALQWKTLQMAVDWAKTAAQDQPRVRYFCPIWQEGEGESLWWMTFNEHTYPHDLLDLLGGENVFGERERRYPLAADLGKEEPEDAGERDTRYPRVTVEEVLKAAPELILLPDEPYAFDEAHGQKVVKLLAATPAVERGRVVLLDGSLITWHGTRLAKALQELPAILSG